MAGAGCIIGFILWDIMLEIKEMTRALQLIQSAKRLIITAGAGMGVDSGLPDFRGVGGFWRVYPALAKLNKSFQTMATPSLFENDPTLAWGFYGLRLKSYRAVIPHEGFEILRRWTELKKKDYFIYTSNVDGQFQKAGFEEKRIHECHGSIHHLQCIGTCTEDIWSASEFMPLVDEELCHLVNARPLCPNCGGLSRPNILMFNDWSWLSWRSESQLDRLHDWLALGGDTVLIEVGSGNAIPSVRNFAERLIRKNQVNLIRINTTDAAVGRAVDVGLEGGALDVLRVLDLMMNGDFGGY